MRRGAKWFIGDMALFLVPAVLAVLHHRELPCRAGLKVLGVILCSSLAALTR
ncbi:MAG: CidA/LrgA family protein [Bradyrhizobium sp.]